MESNLLVQELKNYFKEYQEFKQELSKKISDIKEKNNDKDNSFIFLDEKDLSISFVFFAHLKKNFFNENKAAAISESNNIIIEFAKNSIKNYKFNLIYYWYHYLLISFIKEIKYYLIQKDTHIINTVNFNKIKYIIDQNNSLIIALYNNDAINIKQIISLLDIYIKWIDENFKEIVNEGISFDKFYKIKNYFLFHMYFNLLENIIKIELSKYKNHLKNELKKLFEHLSKTTSNINNSNISIILVNCSSFHNFITTLLYNLDSDLYNQFKVIILNFYKNNIKNSFNGSKIYEKMINNLKKSFLNLSIIEKDGNNKFLENDILIQDFFWELLIDDNYLNKQVDLKFFNFNGIDSRISLELKKTPLTKTLIYFNFSFGISNQFKFEDNNIYPLLIIYDNAKKKYIYKLFIKKEQKNDAYTLYIKTEKEEVELLNLEKEKKKKKLPNDLFYLAIISLKEKLSIYCDNKLIKNIKNKTKIDKKEDNIIQIGYDGSSQDYFIGKIGPLIILKYKQDEKMINKFISKLFKLDDKYLDLLYTLSEKTIYKYDCINFLNCYEKSDIKKNPLKLINNEKKNDLECILYLNPFIIECNSYIPEQSFDKGNLPSVPYICENQLCFAISELNISLIKDENFAINLLLNNGLYYICLQYEYIYQLLTYLLKNNEKKGIKFLIKNEINEKINNIFIQSFKYLSKYDKDITNFLKQFKMVFLNIFTCIKYSNKINANIINDSVLQNLGNLILEIIVNIDDIKEDKKKKEVILFRDGLIDLLLTPELYYNKNLINIKYILGLLPPIYKCKPNNIFISNKNLLWKILSLIQSLESLFENSNLNDSKNGIIKINGNSVDNNMNNNKIKSLIFDFLKEYFLGIKDQPNSNELFLKLFYYCIGNNAKKYHLIYYYFKLIYELICNEYYFKNDEINILMEYIYQLLDDKIEEYNDKKNIINEENNINLNNNDEIKENIISIILKILIISIYGKISEKNIKNNFIELIKSINLTHLIIKSINNPINVLIAFLLNKNNKNNSTENDIDNSKNSNSFKIHIKKEQNKDFPKLFSRLFNLIYAILDSINNDYESQKITIKKNDIKDNMIKTKLNCEVLSLLMFINNSIREDVQNEETNDELYYFLLNYIKFLYKIISNKMFNLLETHILTTILKEVVELSYNELLLNTDFLIKIKINNFDYMKTFIEIVFDIYINILLDNTFEKSHEDVKSSLNSIFNNQNIGSEVHTLFYFNDYIHYNKKGNNQEMNKLYTKIKSINSLLMKENKKFEMNYIIFFLLKIIVYLEYFKKNNFNLDNTLNICLDTYIKTLIEEYSQLCNLNKSIFNKTSKNDIYNNLQKELEEKIFDKKNLKKISIKELDINFLESFNDNNNISSIIIEDITSGNCNLKKSNNQKNENINNIRNFSQIIDNENYINDINNIANRKKYNSFYSKRNRQRISNLNNSPSRHSEISTNENNKSNMIEDEDSNSNDLELNIKEESNIKIDDYEIINKNKDKTEIKKINLSDYLNSINYFEEIDRNYIWNIKKNLMNNVFSLYFIDIFYYNEIFLKMKKSYFNEYKEAAFDTKVLDYPSKIKNFNNGIEPPMFIKQYNNFYDNKYFKISHNYFYEYMNKNNIKNKYINLYPKNIPYSLLNPENNNGNILSLSCELVKINKIYFGQIFIFNEENKEKYLIFQEKEFKINTENADIIDDKHNQEYLFSMTFIINKEKKERILKYQKLKKNINKTEEKRQKRIKEKTIIILFSEIEEILERRFLLMWQGIEIYLKNGKSYLFNLFSEEKKNNILKNFQEIKSRKNVKKEKESNMDKNKDDTTKINLDKNKKNIIENKLKNRNFFKDMEYLIHDKDFLMKEKQISKEWKNFHLSTYEYLLLVNKYGSRSFNDNAQYPVFPWILLKTYQNIKEINEISNNENLINQFYFHKGDNLNIYKNLIKSMRDMKYPICIQTKEKKESLIEKYLEEDGKFKYHLGIHYSTSSYIYYYLMRQEPYSDLLIKLQNYQQENPNRMFIGIVESINLLESSKDPREIIPELFNHFEYLINLNCAFFGIKTDNNIVDDCLINFYNKRKENNPFYNYINFVLEHLKLLNSKILSVSINEWIDNIFGINQLPKSNKEKCCNIYMKSSYEQIFSPKQKLEKYLKKIKENQTEDLNELKKRLLKKLLSNVNSIINFGQTPYQIFKSKHIKIKLKIKKKDEMEEQSDSEEEEEDEDLEKCATMLNKKNIDYKVNSNSNIFYFEINSTINKIFLIDKNRFIEIIYTQLYNKQRSGINHLSHYNRIELPNFFLYDDINLDCNQYNIHKYKYIFCSFDKANENDQIYFRTYGRSLIEDINSIKDKKNESYDDIYNKFISCRYIDKSFKIHIFGKSKNNENNLIPISYVCEDFVTACCTISSCQFLVGLKNGKLIRFYIRKKENENNNNLFKLIIVNYIKAHNGQINVIEINRKLGLVITCGDDNYIFIRKLYDLELLSPIKVKQKYIIILAKVSPTNFLYIICYNTELEKSRIFGYTLTGLKFAKSKYGYYENIDFTLNGNIVTFEKYKDILILSGSELSEIKKNENDNSYHNFIEQKNKIKGALWLNFNYFLNESDDENEYEKIITYYKKDKTGVLNILNVSQNKYFD